MVGRAIDYSTCAPLPACERRVFWVTQPDACAPDTNACGAPCARPGLRMIDVADNCDMLGNFDPCKTGATPKLLGRTIDNSNYMRGLALNILGTNDRRDDTPCGWLPGRRGGYWADSFMGNVQFQGALDDLPATGTIAEALLNLKRAVQTKLKPLVTMAVAETVTVTTTYTGRDGFHVAIDIAGRGSNNLVRVGMTANRLKNSWAWST
jgi:hypothetical protein